MLPAWLGLAAASGGGWRSGLLVGLGLAVASGGEWQSGLLVGMGLAAGGLLALCALLQLAEGAVIGIDLGGEFLKASLVKPRVPLDIVLNPEGRRRSEAVVGFFDGEQAYGGAALNQVRGGWVTFELRRC